MASSLPTTTADLIPSITGAIRDDDDAYKLPATLVSCGIFLIVSKSPGDVLVTWHGSAAAYTYYAVLGATVAFVVAEVLFGLWVDLRRRCWSLTAKVLPSVSLLPLAVVLALWAGLRL